MLRQFGQSDREIIENGNQEASIPQRWGTKLYVGHRFRLEQRWVEDQDQRNRFRYFFSANYPLNKADLSKGSVYLSFYNELFLNLEKDIGRGKSVDTFDRNRTYLALGYSVSNNIRLQFRAGRPPEVFLVKK